MASSLSLTPEPIHAAALLFCSAETMRGRPHSRTLLSVESIKGCACVLPGGGENCFRFVSGDVIRKRLANNYHGLL